MNLYSAIDDGPHWKLAYHADRRHRMRRELDYLDAYATQHNIAPSFTYTGDLEQLRSIAPGAAGRFELRRQIDRMRRALTDG